MTKLYLAAMAFGATLLIVSLVLGGKDTDHGGAGDPHAGGASLGDIGLAWLPVFSLRFWTFLLAFGGGAGYALTRLGSSTAIAAVGAGGVGWIAGALSVAAIRRLTKHSVSSALATADLIGATGTLLLPVAPGRPGKVRVDIKGRIEDYVANIVEGGGELASGAAVMVIAEGERGSLVVAKAEI